MDFKFIAINGDNVGDSIGSAIATDNHDELSRITGGLKDAHSAIEEWVASVGGETVTSSGDEGIYKIPYDSYDEATIDGLRDQYSQTAGTTLTIGIGDSMSEASKALIYGKLNDKDQVVEYDSHIDDYIASHEDEADAEMQGEEGEEQGAEIPEEGEEVDPSQNDEADITVPAEDMVDEHEELVDTLESESHEDDQEAAAEQADELEQYKDIEDSGEDAYIDEGAEDETIAEEGEMSEDDLDVAPEDKLDQVVGEDLDGDGDIDSMPASDDPMNYEEAEEGMGDEVAAANEEMMPEEGDEMAAAGQEAPMDDEMAEDLMAQEAPVDDNSAITDMIHANMGEDGSSPAEDEASDEELRQDIVNSLQTFKENKPMLEQAKTDNPKLYEATILMLRSMIEMAQKLGMNAVEDAEGMEAQAAMPDADMVEPEEGEEMPEEMAEEAPVEEPEEDEDEDEEKKNPFQKSEMTKLYADLMKAVKIVEKAESRWEYWRRKQKEKEREKANKGKRINGKKPLDHALAEVERKMKEEAEKKGSSKKKQ